MNKGCLCLLCVLFFCWCWTLHTCDGCFVDQTCRSCPRCLAGKVRRRRRRRRTMSLRPASRPSSVDLQDPVPRTRTPGTTQVPCCCRCLWLLAPSFLYSFVCASCNPPVRLWMFLSSFMKEEKILKFMRWSGAPIKCSLIDFIFLFVWEQTILGKGQASVFLSFLKKINKSETEADFCWIPWQYFNIISSDKELHCTLWLLYVCIQDWKSWTGVPWG